MFMDSMATYPWNTHLKHLKLKGYLQTIPRPAQTTTHQHLASLDHFPADQRLQPVEVELAISISDV